MNTKIALGLAAIGRPEYINIRKTKELDKSLDTYRANAFSMLDKAFNLGIRHFDVAASYGYGEQFLLDWLNTIDDKGISVSTKWGYTYVANWNLGYNGKHEIKEHSLEKLNSQWEFSKQFLPQLNLYQIHSATLESGVLNNLDVLRRLHELKSEFKIKIGISTSGPNQNDIIKKAETISFDGLSLIDSYQVTYNVLEQSTYTCLKQLRENGKLIIIKEALANGRLFPWYASNSLEETQQKLKDLALDFNVSEDVIALRYIIQKIEPDFILSGASTPNQLKSNMQCLKIDLPLDIVKQMDVMNYRPDLYWSERSELPWH